MKKDNKKDKRVINKEIKKKKKNKKVEDDIEIIDVFGELEKPKVKGKKRKLKKKLLMQTIFCSLSILFIIGCCVFYGLRLIKYYKIYNPKDENGKAISLMANHITSGASFVYEGEGIYLTGGTYIYKGEKVNNYIKYSGLLWRIIKINEDKTIDIVLDNSINSLMWNNKIDDYKDSDINKYLNEVVLSHLNKDLIVKTSTCINIIDDVTRIKCDKFDTSNYVRLLNIDEFLNSKVDEKTDISNDNNIWLSTRGTDKVWTINGKNLSYAEVNNTYSIKPVVTLKSTNQVLGGKGTLDEPYLIEKDNGDIKVGTYIKLGDDIWTVYNLEKDKLYLSLSNLYENGNKTYRFDAENNKYNLDSKYSLAEYLNTEYLNSLPYKDLIIESEWFTGEYKESYKDVMSDKVTAKVGLPGILDFKFDSVSNYYLLNGNDSKIYYIADNELLESKPTLSRAIKPSICIKKAKIKDGNGTKEKPYILEG